LQLPNVIGVACGMRHTIFQCSDGQIYGAGSSKNGAVGTGDERVYHSPVRIKLPEDEKVKIVACGTRHTVVITCMGEAVI